MKNYVEPNLNIQIIQIEDVITTSIITGGGASGNTGGSGSTED